ncbi:multiple sugar transport system permease protein [Mycoplasma testudineum]|uniref:Multiple sugar transport system permease protein n=1 Tax=Mycoplasma testudineum TaxID=244584 RepID=A0A4R6IE52_9MOLU|nr:carbohydrate ABC transporter permease [Mycoplasma testudineum]OYD26742.1 ABC transporter permease [Mycoplasma testudineum]TDO19878.1 multiple sugar transport system permease protein [Mycoplasma testudineum]
MFTTRLKIEKKLNKIKINRIVEKNARQIIDKSVFSVVSSFTFKAIILIFFGFIIMFPFLLMISVALKSDTLLSSNESVTFADLFHNSLNWRSFEDAFRDGYWKAAFYSTVIVIASIIIKLFVTTLLAYAFSFPRWRGKKIAWLMLLSLLILPESALLTGQLIVVNTIGLKVGVAGLLFTLVIPYVASIFHAFLLKAAFEQIPDSIKLVAKIDGFNGFKFFMRIALPMVSPTTWTIIILTALASWDSFLWPSIILAGLTGSEADFDRVSVISLWTISSGQRFNDLGETQGFFINIRLAAAMLAIAPVFIFYFIFRRKIMNAISKQGSAIKG